MECLLVAQKAGQYSILSPQALQDNGIFFIPYDLKKNIVQLFSVIGFFTTAHLY
jgi:hypothetical protein